MKTDIFEQNKAQDEVDLQRDWYDAVVVNFYKNNEMTTEKKKLLVDLATDIEGNIPDDFCCPICLSLVYEPLTCNTC